MMGSLLPKTVVILGVVLFLLLVEPPTVSGLKCYQCKGRHFDVARDAPIANISGSNGTIGILGGPSNIGFGSKGVSARAGETEEDCVNEETTCKADDKTSSHMCFKQYATKSGAKTHVKKSCTAKMTGMEAKCSDPIKMNEYDVIYCYCDTDLCNGGRSLKEGFGLMSLTLGVISVYKLL